MVEIRLLLRSKYTRRFETYAKETQVLVWAWKIKDYDLPAMQAPSGTYFTSTSVLDLWIIAARKAQRKARTGKAQGEDIDYRGIDTF
jgi:hypothetical protein